MANRKLIANKIKEFAGNYPAKHVPPGLSLHHLSGKDSNCFFLEEGEVRLYVKMPKNKHFTVQIFSSGCVFPLTSILTDNDSDFNLETLTPVKLRVIPVIAMRNYISHNQEVGFEVATRIAEGSNRLVMRLGQAYFCSASKRIASILLYLADTFGDNNKEKPGSINLRCQFTHEQIASLTGLSRETVSRELEDLNSRNIVELKYKKITILNRNALAEDVKDQPMAYRLFECIN